MISKTIRILIKMHNEVEYLNEKAVYNGYGKIKLKIVSELYSISKLVL